MSIEVGRIKNVNKNPVAEKAIAEVEDELRRQLPGGGPVTEFGLATAVSRLNSHLRRDGVSVHELWTQRNQYFQKQPPLDDRETIINQHKAREINHSYNEQSKNSTQSLRNTPQLKVGDLVYLPLDHDKTQSRHRYLVISLETPWCFIRKFTGNQLRASSYKVRISDSHLVPPTRSSASHTECHNSPSAIHPMTAIVKKTSQAPLLQFRNWTYYLY